MKNPIEDIVRLNFNQNGLLNFGTLEKCEEEKLRKEPSFSRTLWQDALILGGPYTKYVLDTIGKHLKFDRKYTLVDVQVQYLRPSQYTTNKEGTSWHLDGATSVHPILTEFIGGKLVVPGRGMLDLHDTLARDRKMKFYSVFSGEVSRTQYVEGPLSLDLPKCVQSFEWLSEKVEESKPKVYTQLPLNLISFDDSTLHRGTAATGEGWRYWVRVGEIDFFPRPRSRPIDTVYDNN